VVWPEDLHRGAEGDSGEMRVLLTVLLLGLAACQTPRNPEAWMEAEVNACLPTAIAMRAGLERSGVWADVFRYKYYDGSRLRGHAMTAYLYPPGKNQLWTYDQLGSWRTRAWTNDVAAIARHAHSVRGWRGTATDAEWVR
jgi:hypothetical protein